MGLLGLLGQVGFVELLRGVELGGSVPKKLWQTLKVCQSVWRIGGIMNFELGGVGGRMSMWEKLAVFQKSYQIRLL